ncbi:hypothetical protein CC78DRAFT_531618 [Lojkania enalia]|uniref:Uncharacterized protein n=1 Tax=Lojkania enalia TaxID=147567 RepID=A0A9P4KD72_9PLEO|nr:hypothetical protein CC78DRAFT_531618 [Didymosphaeria enalia]
MPVTTRAAPVKVKCAPSVSQVSPTVLFRSSCDVLSLDGNEVWDSSFQNESAIQPSRNGLVSTVVDAYLQHNHLILRPEDVWFAILVQFSFYVNKHAEELRKYFVDFKGKRKLKIDQPEFNIRVFCLRMTELIAENVKDPLLKEWIMPTFTTTTDTDRVTAATIMMGTMQKYFVYFNAITCGIPSVTLLGEKSDWEDILERVSYLGKFGLEHEELLIWNSVLAGIVSKFVETFDAPDSLEVVKFWQGAVHHYVDDYLGEKRITGWIQAFCFWNAEGKPLVANNVRRITADWRMGVRQEGSKFWFDGVRLGELDWEEIPAGFAHVPIHIKCCNEKFMGKLIAGSIGWRVVDSEAIFCSTRGIKNSSPKVKKVRSTKVMHNYVIGKKLSGPSMSTGTTLVANTDTRQPSFIRKFIRKLPCFSTSPEHSPSIISKIDKKTPNDLPELQFQTDNKAPSSVPELPLNNDEPKVKNEEYTPFFAFQVEELKRHAPQISDLSELNQPWEYETGGQNDSLQPVTGWWLMMTKEGQYGRDPDFPNVQYDSDAEDYDEDLARNGRPLDA